MQKMRHAHRHDIYRAESDAVRASVLPVIRLVLVLIMAAVMAVPACAARQTIQKVDVANLDNAVQITVNSSQPLSIKDSRLGSKYIIFDLSGSLMRGEQKKVEINSDGIKTVKCGWFRSAPPVARIVVSTTGYSEYSIRFEDGKRRTVIKVAKIGATARYKEAVGIEPSVSVKRDSKPVLVASTEPMVPKNVQVASAAQNIKPQPKITLDFVASDIHDVLKALAMQGRVNIVASPEVKGDITVSLSNVTVEEALKLITNLSGFRFAEMDGVYVVGTQENLKSLVAGGSTGRDERATDVAIIKYADPGVVGKILEKEFGMMQVTTAAAGDGKSGPAGPTFLVLSGRPGEVQAAKAMVESIENASSAIMDSCITEIYEVKYVDIKELAATLSAAVRGLRVGIGPNQGFNLECPSSVATGAESGGSAGSAGGAAAQKAPSKALILQGIPEDIAKAKTFLAQVDIAQSQIVIEAKVVDINNNDSKNLGIDWNSGNWNSIRIGETDRTAAEYKVDDLGNITVSKPALDPITFGKFHRTPLELLASINALITTGKGRILANPNVTALDGKPASIFIGDEVTYVISNQVTPTGINTETETVKVGIQLHTISRINSDNLITMDLHPEVSVITRWLSTPSGLSLPQIARRYVDTTIRVKDGETIVIGGLIKDEEIETISGLPFLQNLPILGSIFKNKTKNKTHSEIMMFITPRIISN